MTDRSAPGSALASSPSTSALFAASSTDVLANFFHVSLNIVLWSFRFIVIVVPLIVGFVTWRICLDMAGVPGIGKRKRAVVVMRTASGEYSTVASPHGPGDGSRRTRARACPEVDRDP